MQFNNYLNMSQEGMMPTKIEPPMYPVRKDKRIYSKYWNFVLIKPTFEEKRPGYWNFSQFEYIIIGEEINDEGVPYFQGFCIFMSANTLDDCKAISPRAAWGMKSSDVTVKLSSDYCKKDEKFIQAGYLPRYRNPTRMCEKWSLAMALANRPDNCDDVEWLMYGRYHPISKVMRDITPLDHELQFYNYWMVAHSGLGRQRYARAFDKYGKTLDVTHDMKLYEKLFK